MKVAEQRAQLCLALLQHGGTAVQLGRTVGAARGCGDGVELFKDLRKALQQLLGGLAHLRLRRAQVRGPDLRGLGQAQAEFSAGACGHDVGG